jgi:hypothetical protein
VSADHSDNVTAAIRPELRSWLAGGEPWVVALGAAAFEVLDKENRGALHAQLTSEKLASAAHQARAWQFKNPGPVQVIADEFAGIFNKFTALADEYVVAAEFTPDDPSPDLDGRLERAILALYEAEHAAERGEESFKQSYIEEQGGQ